MAQLVFRVSQESRARPDFKGLLAFKESKEIQEWRARPGFKV
jgi:hypothetical protein